MKGFEEFINFHIKSVHDHSKVILSYPSERSSLILGISRIRVGLSNHDLTRGLVDKGPKEHACHCSERIVPKCYYIQDTYTSIVSTWRTVPHDCIF